MEANGGSGPAEEAGEEAGPAQAAPVAPAAPPAAPARRQTPIERQFRDLDPELRQYGLQFGSLFLECGFRLPYLFSGEENKRHVYVQKRLLQVKQDCAVRIMNGESGRLSEEQMAELQATMAKELPLVQARLLNAIEQLELETKAEEEKEEEEELRDDDLGENVRVMREDNGRVVYLIGTAHVSNQSCEEVADVIRRVKPDTVMIELCTDRLPLVLAEKKRQTDAEKAETLAAQWRKLAEAVRNGSDGIATQVLSIISLTASKNIETTIGEEFRVAMHEAMKVGAIVVLGDRDIKATVGRLWARLSLYEKIKGGLMLAWMVITGVTASEEDIEDIKKNDMLEEAIQEVARLFPSVATAVLAERDLFLASSIQHCPGKKVVAVVGKGHFAGILANWDTKVDLKELTEIPVTDPDMMSRVVAWCVRATLKPMKWVASFFLPA